VKPTFCPQCPFVFLMITTIKKDQGPGSNKTNIVSNETSLLVRQKMGFNFFDVFQISKNPKNGKPVTVDTMLAKTTFSKTV
jgi:hypothetical protein